MTRTTQRTTDMPHLYSRIFGAPLAISRPKLDAILTALAPRLGVVAPLAEVPAFDPKSRGEAQAQDGVAVIPIIGTLVHRAGGLEALSGMSSYGEIAADIDAALADRNVKGILLELDSPGGEVSGMLELASKIEAANAIKPVFAIANSMACSAAYALASAADQIFVSPTADVGSIGIVALHVDQSAADQKDGLKYTYVFAGDKKVDGNPHAPLSPRAHAQFQSDIDAVYDMFVKAVAARRDMPQKAVRGTEAGTFMGEAAVAAELADQVGTLEDAKASLRAEINRRAKMNFQAKAAVMLALPEGATEEQVLAAIDSVKLGKADLEKKVAEALERSKKAEDARVADRKAHATAIVELARKASTKSGVLLGADESKDLEDMLGNGSEREVRFAHRRIDEHLAKTDTAPAGGTLKPVKPPQVAEQDAAIAESDQQVARMLASRGIKPLTGKE